MTTTATVSEITPPQKRLYSLAETAFALGVSVRTLYRLIDAGALPAVIQGGQRRVRAEAIDTYLDNLLAVPVKPATDARAA